MMAVPEAATRVAMLERGEADIMYFVPGELIARVKSNPKLTLAPVVSANWWLEFPGFQDPKSPFHDKRVREAISLAIDRDAMNQAECDGMGVIDGNWINDDVEYGMPWPKWPHDIAKAKQLMAEAGYPNGFARRLGDAGAELLFARRAHRLAVGGDRHPRQEPGHGARRVPEENGDRAAASGPGCRSSSTRRASAAPGPTGTTSMFKCGGFQSKDFFCVKELDDKFATYLASLRSQAERKNLADEIQRDMLENYYFVPVFRHAFVNAIGPRIAAKKWQDVFPTITSGYAYPWEDIQLKANLAG